MTKKRSVISENSAFARVALAGGAGAGLRLQAAERLTCRNNGMSEQPTVERG
ncbi:hypothetical protein DES44_4052 [Roseateles depolymerans]|uniref:Uncharacterized protein n=1 Tax=Roseateles depolymerans TaxID=76731 RepID=A0A0U3M7G5_9BURK|nr:hypothetical protein RD2015_2 [Roseateles depolymerans]REG14040.1 hypothetical protein DES44_4052 [Roseateles depolymerans]